MESKYAVNQSEHLKALTIHTIILWCLTPCVFLFPSVEDGYENFEFIINSLYVVFAYWCIYHFNNGRNWARYMVLIASVLAILSLLIPFETNVFLRILLVAEALYGVYLIYWLNTESVKRFFNQKDENESI